MTNNNDQNGGYPPDELAERQQYIDKIMCWNESLAQGGSLDNSEFRYLLSRQPTIELAGLYLGVQLEIFASWVLWGSEHLASGSPEQREAVIDAIVLQGTTGRYSGRESSPTATAGGYFDEAPLLWARTRRERLKDLSMSELATECRKMLEAEAERVAQHNHVIRLARLDASRRMRELVSSRYSYRPALIEAARYCRQQKLYAARAADELAKKPLKCTDGSVVTFRDDKFVVKRGDEVIITVTAGTFQKTYWPLGRIPPTP